MTPDGDHVDPDPFVRTALQLLPVPPHREGFWETLRTALDAEPNVVATAMSPVDAAGDAPPVDTPGDVPAGSRHVIELQPTRHAGLVPPAVRRRSNVVLSAVAVAAAVVVVLAGTTLVRERSGDGADTDTELAGATEDTRGAELTSSTSMSSSTTLTTITGSGSEVLPTNAVLTWLNALSSGDIDSAWAAMGPASQQHWGSKSAFEAERSGLAEGYGAWSSATPDEVHVTSLTASGDGEVVVVTLVGTVDQEGTRQQRADAFPVRVVHGVAKLEPYAFAGELEIVVPEAVASGGTRPIVEVDDELIIVVPRGVEAPLIRLDDGDTLVCGQAEGTELTELEEAPGQRCSYRPEGGIEPGQRVLTVAFLSPDGTGISAESVLFEAA
jgi:hypothetical protein